MMKVTDIMTENPAFCSVDTPLQEVARMMAECDCGSIPVTDQSNKPIGVVTDRDITIRTLAHGKNPFEMIAGEVMTDNPVTVTPDTSLEECCNIMEKNQIRRIIVVNENGAVCGVVAQADVANNASRRQTAEVVQEVSKSAGS
jgi:CBS domain-containing protein